MTARRIILVALFFTVFVTAFAASSPNAAAKKKRIAKKEVAALGEAVLGADEAAAQAAAKRLGEVSNRSATAALTDALALGLAPNVALAALGALEARADATALPTLEYYLKVRPKKLRVASVRAAAATATPKGDALVTRALDDHTREVRGTAATMVKERKITSAATRLIELLIAGSKPAASALAAIANAEIALAVAETIGQAPHELVADSLGEMLLRESCGPDSLRVEVVRALAKVPGGAGALHLAAYVAATPEKPPRKSRREAEALMRDNL